MSQMICNSAGIHTYTITDDGMVMTPAGTHIYTIRGNMVMDNAGNEIRYITREDILAGRK